VAGYDLSRAMWRVSSYSGQTGACVEVAVVPDSTAWRVSSYSGQTGNCVQVVTNAPGVVGVRDSKDAHGPVLAFTPDAWSAFTEHVKGGQAWLD
jgi:Domain of unknown function (DUF397)